MNTPRITQCPACKWTPQPEQVTGRTAGFSCRACGFYGSIEDMIRADYLSNFYPALEVTATAHRIAARSTLIHGQGKAS
ncbi:MAG: hypothetical protein O3B95_05305 [Chloroflexi bacterium]|nr:hypothetical protein [Chloroflexota bacterium]